MASEENTILISDSTKNPTENFDKLDCSPPILHTSEKKETSSCPDNSLDVNKLDSNLCGHPEVLGGKINKLVVNNVSQEVAVEQNLFLYDESKNYVAINELIEPPETTSEPIKEEINGPEEISGIQNFQENKSLIGENSVLDRFQVHTVTDGTPSKCDFSNVFEKGVHFASTPLHLPTTMKEIKNLSIIKEEEESSSSKLEDTKITVIEQNNVNLTPNEVKNIYNPKEILHFEASKDISDLSILRKDQLSLLIDVGNEALLKDKKIDFSNQNLTLTINNNESVVYKDIIDKNVDELLIDDGLIPVKEVNNVEPETDQIKILNKVAAVKEFISSNAEENKDNDDPEWELLKKLETDDERYKAVRKLWRNLTIPDLKKNLSTFNWRKKNSLTSLKKIKPLKIDPISKKKKNLIYKCTEVFDQGAKNLIDLYHRQSQGIIQDYDEDMSVMVAAKKKPRMEAGYSRRLMNNYQDELYSLKESINERLLRLEEGKEEINALHSFYNGLKNQGNGGYGNMMLISHSERRDILDIENMINHYSSWYRENSK